MFSQGYLVEIRKGWTIGEETWQVWGSGTVKDLLEKRSYLIDQAKRYNKPQNLGELIIADEEDVSLNVFGYGEWNE
jgi:hypothetical protein